ncbi:unnamed protein product [Triticum turgidum subsp. durum]|uniref:Uncharacterized protein n=1 Tax=Triticum turgidum subsp. durum TaxID=4567 RepID=A0A9R0YLF4_TRITD|nr:unnamed protein product [Triticum turgidum subsp. durum]
MARGDHQSDDDDFMDPPQRNQATGQRKEGDEKKKRIRNRASQERLTVLIDKFTDDQKGATAEMGMQVLMDVRCTNPVNPVCDWLGEIYDPASREFVIPGRGRLPLNEESVFCTLGVPRGHIKVPYEANLKNMKSMNWCKFIADFLHDALKNKMYQKGCRLHLMARAPVEHLIGQFASGMTGLLRKLVEGWTSLSAFDSDVLARQFTSFVPERTHRPTGCRGRYDYNSSQEPGDTQDDVDGDAGLRKDDDDDTNDDEHAEVRTCGNKGKDATGAHPPEKVKEHTTARGEGVLPSRRGRAPEDVGQGSAGKRSRIDPVAARKSEPTAGGRAATKKQAPTPTRVSARLNKGAPIAGDIPSTRSSARTTTTNTGDPVVLPDLRKAVKKVKKTTTRGAKHISRDPLERLHSKLSTGGNSDVHEVPGDNTTAAPSTARTNSDASGRPSPPAADVQARTTGIRTSGSDESVSASTAEILPSLLAMKYAAVSHATPSASVEVDAPETNLGKEDSRSSDTDSKRVPGVSPVSMTEAAEAALHKDMPSADENPGTTAPAPVGGDTTKATVPRAGLPPRRRSPRKQSTDIPNAPAVARSRRDESGYVPASTLFPPPAKINVMEKPQDRSTTDAGVKPGTSDAEERLEQTAPSHAAEIPSINLRTSRLPVNVGVPYSPNKKIVMKAAAETADNTPRPANKADHFVAANSDMFVDLSPLDSAPKVVRGPASRNERHPMAFTPPSFSLGVSQDQPVVHDPIPVAFAFLGGMPAMMAQPMVEGRKAVKFAEPIVQATPEEISPSLDEVYRMIEETSLQRSSSRGQGQSSSNVPADTVSEDTIRSVTPGPVRQQRVVHPPPAEDYETEFRATKEQTQLYDIVKRFGNARTNSKHMKELKV